VEHCERLIVYDRNTTCNYILIEICLNNILQIINGIIIRNLLNHPTDFYDVGQV